MSGASKLFKIAHHRRLTEHRKAIVADALAGTSAVVYLTELDEAAKLGGAINRF